MKVVFFSAKPYDIEFFENHNKALPEGEKVELDFLKFRLDERSAPLATAAGKADVVCPFVNDDLSTPVLRQLYDQGVRHIALRCAGFNNVDLEEAKKLGMSVSNVPAYSPNAVAEHAVAMLMTLNRHTHRAHIRTREGDFHLQGLLGMDIAGKTVGIMGSGKIGRIFAKIMKAFDAKILAYDIFQSQEAIDMGIEYVSQDELFARCDVISLHLPLTPETKHIIHKENIQKMKKGVILVNTGRGALCKTQDLIEGLRSGIIGGLGLDVLENESEIFYEDHSDEVLKDDALMILLSMPNVLITSHQAFFTKEALTQIATTTMKNVNDYKAGRKGANFIVAQPAGPSS